MISEDTSVRCNWLLLDISIANEAGIVNYGVETVPVDANMDQILEFLQDSDEYMYPSECQTTLKLAEGIGFFGPDSMHKKLSDTLISIIILLWVH